MPRIPDSGARQTPRYGGQIVDISTRGIGSGLSAVGQVAQQFIDRRQIQEDEAAVNEFRSKLNAWENQTVYDPEIGLSARRGKDAFSIGEDLQNGFSKFMETAGVGSYSPRAQQAITRISESRREQLNDWANRYVGQQRELYFNEQFEANNQTSIRRAALLATDSASVDAELRLMRDRVVNFHRSRGVSEEAIIANVATEEQKFHGGVMANLFSQDDYEGVSNYFNRYNNRMSIDQIINGRAAIDKMRKNREVITVVDDVINNSGPVSMANSGQMSTIQNVVMQLESGGRRFNDEGQLLTSEKGALGEMQVMPETAKDPGFGIVPARNDSPEELARVGNEYINALVRHFGGDIDKALAAYNGGFARVEQAVIGSEDAGVDWLALMPEETQNYVAKGRKMFGNIEKRGSKLNRDEYDAMLRARIKDPEQLQDARRELDLRLRLEEDSIKKGRDRAQEEAILFLDKGNSFNSMPVELYNRLDPSVLPQLRNYAKSVIDGADTPTDWALYGELIGDKNRLKNTNLTAEKYRLGDTEYKELLRLQSTPEKQNNLISHKAMAEQLMAASGEKITGTKGKEKVGRFMWEMSRRVGSDVPQDQFYKEAAKLLTDIKIGRTVLWNKDIKLYELQPDEIDRVVVPLSDRQAISEALKNNGLPVTELAIKSYYIRGLNQ